MNRDELAKALEQMATDMEAVAIRLQTRGESLHVRKGIESVLGAQFSRLRRLAKAVKEETE